MFDGLSYVSHKIFSPVLVVGNNLGQKFKTTFAYFASKNSLYKENQTLQAKINEEEARMENHNALLQENESLKETLGRKNEGVSMVLGAILSKPNQSPYDILLIDVGVNKGIKKGNVVFADGNLPIGRVETVYDNSSKVILFSSPRERTQVIVGSNVFMELVGRGGGNFEMILPRDFMLKEGDQVILPGIRPYVVGTVEKIISDPRDAYLKALFLSPVNIQELKFVEVEQK